MRDNVGCFIGEGFYMAVGITEYRYGKTFVAMMCHENALSSWIDHINDENGESEYEFWGLRNSDWFPIAFGTTPHEALTLLDDKLEATKPNWEIVCTALRRLESEKLERRQVCNVLSINELVTENNLWETTDIISMLSPRQGFV